MFSHLFAYTLDQRLLTDSVIATPNHYHNTDRHDGQDQIVRKLIHLKFKCQKKPPGFSREAFACKRNVIGAIHQSTQTRWLHLANRQHRLIDQPALHGMCCPWWCHSWAVRQELFLPLEIRQPSLLRSYLCKFSARKSGARSMTIGFGILIGWVLLSVSKRELFTTWYVPT